MRLRLDSRARAATSPQVENAQELSLDLPARRRPMSCRRVTGAAVLSAAQIFRIVVIGVARAFFVRLAASGAGARGPKGTLRRAALLRA